MGQENSRPQPAAWQPDFLTAHVQNVSKQLSPVKAPLQGLSSMGADSLSISSATKVQEAIKTTDGGAKGEARSYQGRPSGLDHHSYMGVAQKKAADVVALDRPAPIGRPTVGADSFLMVKQRKFAEMQNKGFRNQMSLAPNTGKEAFFAAKGMDKPGGHQTIDSYENQFCLDTKKITAETTGPHGPYGRHQAPEIGKPTNLKGDSYYVEFAKTTHSWLAPKSKSNDEWRGIKPHIPVQDFVKKDKDEKKANILENNKIKALPVPQVGSDAYMISHSRQMNDITSTSPLKFGGRSTEPQPYHGFDITDSPYAMMTPQKAEPAGPSEPPKVGADSFMNTFSKKAGTLKDKALGRETSKQPPKEVTL